MRRLVIAVLAVLVAGTGVLVAAAREPAPPPVDAVHVGTGPEGEQRLLATILAELLRAKGVPAEVREFSRSRDARQALELREVDVVPSYTGAVWLDELQWAAPTGDPIDSYERVREADARDGLVWLDATGANATFAFVVLGPPSLSARMATVADLAGWLNTNPEDRLCVDEGFAERADGLESLARLYAISNEVLARQILAASPGEAVAAVVRGECVAGLTSATDGRAAVAGLRRLEDGLEAFPAMVAAAVVTAELQRDRPDAVEALAPFGPALTTDLLARWNGRVLLGRDVEQTLVTVAREAAATLLAAQQAPTEEPTPGA